MISIKERLYKLVFMHRRKKSFHLKLDIEREIEMRNIVEIKEVFKTIDKEEILWYQPSNC